MIIKAFNNYILSIYLYHATIIMQFLQDEKKDDIAIRISNSMEKKTNAGKNFRRSGGETPPILRIRVIQ